MDDIAVGIFQETLEQLIVSSEFKSITEKKSQLRSLRRSKKKKLRSLQDEIKCMRGFLEVTEKKRYEYSEVMSLVRQIKDVVSEAENIVELFVVQAVKALDADQVHPSLHLGRVIKKINALTAKIKNIYDQNMFDIKGVADQKLEHSVSKSEEGSSSSGRSTTSKVVEEKDVVGFKEEVDKLLGTLCGNGEGGELEIISIVGAAGGGKTTLATQVYKHPLISSIFTIRAWVGVSQEYDKTKKRNMLIRILESADPRKDKDYECRTDDQLGEDTFKCLKGKKFLIVMDDIWDTKAWDDIQRSFPKESKGSKVLFTSRLHVQPDGIRCFNPHRLAPFPKDSSWELLQNKVFGKKSCLPELVGIGKDIAEKCEGLPLAIVAIAGILAMEDKTVDAWEKVSKHLSSIIAENQDGCMKILELSYNHLPLHLKACFAYICGFPEDSEILVDELMWLWIAEGFVQQSKGDKSLEDVAKDYLSNLIDRNLIMEATKRCCGGIKACRIHDLLRELCLKKAEEDKFLVQIYGDHTFSPSASTMHRRLFIGSKFFSKSSMRHFSKFFSESSMRHFTQNLRSLLFFLNEPYLRVRVKKLSFFAENFELLRVLCFQSILCGGQKIGRGDLVHLRYLGLILGQVNVVPNLFNLETLFFKRLSIRRHAQEIILPCYIFKMVKLRHLYAKRGVFKYCHKESGSGSNEEPESGYESCSKLDSLQTLQSICACEVCKNFLARTPNLRKLGFRATADYKGQNFFTPLDLEFLKCLEKLKIKVRFLRDRLPPVLKISPTVTQLTLNGTELKWEELSILQTALPNLEVLKLLKKACLGGIWDTSELEGFSHLKYLRLQDLKIEEWIASEDQFPRLEVLVVKHCTWLMQIPIDFANLNELHEIEVTLSNLSVEKSAKDILKERIDTRGDDGCINLLLYFNSQGLSSWDTGLYSWDDFFPPELAELENNEQMWYYGMNDDDDDGDEEEEDVELL